MGSSCDWDARPVRRSSRRRPSISRPPSSKSIATMVRSRSFCGRGSVWTRPKRCASADISWSREDSAPGYGPRRRRTRCDCPLGDLCNLHAVERCEQSGQFLLVFLQALLLDVAITADDVRQSRDAPDQRLIFPIQHRQDAVNRLAIVLDETPLGLTLPGISEHIEGSPTQALQAGQHPECLEHPRTEGEL